MSVFELSDENIDDFTEILGEDLFDDMQRTFYRGYGSSDDDGNVNGVLVYEVQGLDDDDQDTIGRMIYISADSDEAYEELHSIYKEEGVPDEEITESFYEFEDEAMATSCEKAGFTKVSRESKIVRIALKDACEFDFLKKIKKLPDYIVPLEELSVMQFRSGIKNCLFNGQSGILEDLGQLSMGWFDTEVSSCTITDDEVSGFFLVRKTPSGVIIPVMLYATGTDYVKNLALMIAQSINVAAKNYPPDTEVVIHRSKKASAALIKKLIPAIKGNAAFFGERVE